MTGVLLGLVLGMIIGYLVWPHDIWTVPLLVAPTAKRVPGPSVRVQFRSGSGRRVLATVSMPASQRRPSVSWPTADGMGVFQADHEEPDGVWVYRRVAVERHA